jgi:hypothetical protein
MPQLNTVDGNGHAASTQTMHLTQDGVLAMLAHAASRRTPSSVLVRVRAEPPAIVQPCDPSLDTEPFTQIDPADRDDARP